MPFKALLLSEPLLRGVQAAGYTDPTPIQLRAIPAVLSGRDLIASAQTGTGKTAAFALPVLTASARHGRARVLVLEPTRELAAQVETAFRDFARFTDLRTVAIFGGVGYGHQRNELTTRRRHHRRHPRPPDRLPQGRHHQPARHLDPRSSTRSTACSTWASCPS